MRHLVWLEWAATDEAAARALTPLGLHSTACYHASQAAEKTLKAALVYLGADPVRTRSLVRLSKAVESAGYPLSIPKSRLVVLTRHATHTRYPDSELLPDELYSETDSQEAIAAMVCVQTACEDIFPAGRDAPGDKQ